VLIHNLAVRAVANQSVRLLVEVHSGNELRPRWWSEMLQDVLALRELYGEACEVKLATVVRRPLEHILSLHNYAVRGQVPLCVWEPVTSPQLRLLFGLPLGAASARAQMTCAHLDAISTMLRAHFDVVGVLDEFELTVSALVDTFGLQAPAMLSWANTAGDRLRSYALAGGVVRCQGSAGQMAPMHALLRKRIERSARNARTLRRQNPKTRLSCREYACSFNGSTSLTNRVWHDEYCKGQGGTPAAVLRRLCAQQARCAAEEHLAQSREQVASLLAHLAEEEAARKEESAAMDALRGLLCQLQVRQRALPDGSGGVPRTARAVYLGRRAP
jgi:hypothetical protein